MSSQGLRAPFTITGTRKLPHAAACNGISRRLGSAQSFSASGPTTVGQAANANQSALNGEFQCPCARNST